MQYRYCTGNKKWLHVRVWHGSFSVTGFFLKRKDVSNQKSKRYPYLSQNRRVLSRHGLHKLLIPHRGEHSCVYEFWLHFAGAANAGSSFAVCSLILRKIYYVKCRCSLHWSAGNDPLPRFAVSPSIYRCKYWSHHYVEWGWIC